MSNWPSIPDLNFTALSITVDRYACLTLLWTAEWLVFHMRTWQTETSTYVARLESASAHLKVKPPCPANIPPGPLDSPPSLLQSVLHQAMTFYEFGVWYRAQETVESIVTLWHEGYLASGAALARLVFEIWGACHCMTTVIQTFANQKDVGLLVKTVNKLFEGVRGEVILPWGTPASEKPIHVLDTIRLLGQDFPGAMASYEDLCESAHANQPRFMEWWVLGKAGANWTNGTVQARGHVLMSKTVEVMEKAILGIKAATEKGMVLCGELY